MSDDRSREHGLLQDVRDQNSRLRQLIEITARLLARSRALLLRLRATGPTTDTDRRAE